MNIKQKLIRLCERRFGPTKLVKAAQKGSRKAYDKLMSKLL